MSVLDDSEIATMSRAERRSLARRLLAVDDPVPGLRSDPETALAPDPRRERRRRRFVLLAGVCSLAMVPWIVVLAVTLPHRYVSPDWTLTWVGFDVGLLAAMLATTFLAWRRQRRVLLAAAVTATLLCCDAWFDITTAHKGGLAVSLGSAALIELPLAALLLWVVFAATRRAARSPAAPTPAPEPLPGG